VVEEYGGRARFRSENYGESDLAKRFGVSRYPAIFVDDILVATPNDFGFYGKGEKNAAAGRYAPLKDAASHERFRGDLRKMIDLILAGKKEQARAAASPAQTRDVASFPDVTFTDLDGKNLARAELAGKVVVVEMWATWCPPCRKTLRELAELRKRYGSRVAVVTLAIDSDPKDVRRIADSMGRDAAFTWTMATPDVVRSFGDVSAVPTLLIFDGTGRTAATLYGAPPTLHQDLEAKLTALLG